MSTARFCSSSPEDAVELVRSMHAEYLDYRHRASETVGNVRRTKPRESLVARCNLEGARLARPPSRSATGASWTDCADTITRARR